MKPTIERLTEQFTTLIGPDAFAKAEAAIAAAKAAAEVAAKAAAEKAAAAAAAAKAAAEKAAAEKAAAAAAGTPATPAASPAPAATPATTPATKPVVAVAPAVAPAAAPRPAAPAAARPATPAAARPAAPAPAAAPVAPPMPTLPVQVVAQAAKGYQFDATVAPAQVVQAAELLDREGFAIDTITGVDWLPQNEMEIVYDYFHPTEGTRVAVRARVPRATPELPTISAVFPGANWHERETHDFFGIRFTGHPNLKPFLLPEDAEFHPLRKDYQP